MEERALAEKKELQTNSEGENIINRSTESIKQCKYEKCQAQVHELLQEWTLLCTQVTSVYEDKQERALVGRQPERPVPWVF